MYCYIPIGGAVLQPSAVSKTIRVPQIVAHIKSTTHQSTTHQSTTHQSTTHQSTTHQSTTHQSTTHQSTTHHSTTNSTTHQSTTHQSTTNRTESIQVVRNNRRTNVITQTVLITLHSDRLNTYFFNHILSFSIYNDSVIRMFHKPNTF